MTLDEVLSNHSDQLDSIVKVGFTDQYERILGAATKDVQKQLTERLKITDGKVANTISNHKTLATVDDMFKEALDANGFGDLLQSYTDKFDGQFESFNSVLAHVSGELKYPLPPVTFTKGKIATINLQKVKAQELLRGVTELAAMRAKAQALQSVGALTPRELAASVSETLGTSLAQAETIADTSISTFYRTITDKGYQQIEADLPGFKIRYKYLGPLDRITRPFCTKLEVASRAGRSWTRDQINRMNNGQKMPVFTTCGGFNCRHQWIISASDLNQEQKTKEVPAKTDKKLNKMDLQEEIRARRKAHKIVNKKLYMLQSRNDAK